MSVANAFRGHHSQLTAKRLELVLWWIMTRVNWGLGAYVLADAGRTKQNTRALWASVYSSKNLLLPGHDGWCSCWVESGLDRISVILVDLGNRWEPISVDGEFPPVFGGCRTGSAAFKKHISLFFGVCETPQKQAEIFSQQLKFDIVRNPGNLWIPRKIHVDDEIEKYENKKFQKMSVPVWNFYA